MEKFEALLTFLKAMRLVSDGDLDAWIETVAITRVGRQTTEGFHLLDATYQAQFDFEGCNQHALVVPTVIQCWLSDHDSSRRDDVEGKVKMNITEAEKGRYNIDVQIPFKEAVYIKEDVNGTIHYQGKKWTGGAVAAVAVTDIETVDPENND